MITYLKDQNGLVNSIALTQLPIQVQMNNRNFALTCSFIFSLIHKKKVVLDCLPNFIKLRRKSGYMLTLLLNGVIIYEYCVTKNYLEKHNVIYLILEKILYSY